MRSWLHPLVFAAPMWALQKAGLDSRAAVIVGPKVVAGVMAGLCDAAAWRWASGYGMFHSGAEKAAADYSLRAKQRPASARARGLGRFLEWR